MSGRPNAATAICVVLFLIVAGACGSTAKVGKTSREEGTVTSAAPSSTTAPTASAAATRAGGSSGSVTTAPAQSVGGIPVGSVARSRFVPAHAPGITSKTIYVGIGYSSQSAAADKAIGAAGAAPSYDPRNVINAMISYANTHGGFAGRSLQAIYYDANLTASSSTEDQAACALWTQDNKVFVIVSGNDILDSCAQKAGAIGYGAGSATEATFQKYPHLIDPEAFSLDRLGQVTVSRLDAAHYFTGKFGLVTWDDPNYRASIQNGYLPALAKAHVKALQIAYIGVPQQIGGLGDTTAAVSSAVAKFKALGIDHVIVQDGPAGVFGGTGLTLEWMDQAQSQNYHPRYGQNTYNSPGWDVLPSSQMDHALAIDQSDYDISRDAGWHPNTFRQECFKIEADAGYPVSSSNFNDEALAGGACDFVFFLQRVVNSLSTVTADGLISSAGKLGTSLPSAVVYGTKLIPGRRDGGDQVRTEEYLASCKCLKYQGPPAHAD